MSTGIIGTSRLPKCLMCMLRPTSPQKAFCTACDDKVTSKLARWARGDDKTPHDWVCPPECPLKTEA